jgi:hypothetical protein
VDKFCGCALAGQRSIAQVVAHHDEFALVFLGEPTIQPPTNETAALLPVEPLNSYS